jgi:hypothetical protein
VPFFLVAVVVLISGGQSILLKGIPSIVGVDVSTGVVSEARDQFDIEVDASLGQSQSFLAAFSNTVDAYRHRDSVDHTS